ncbi:MAG: hypothetical protein ACK5QH_01775 [Rubrivivax sp.]
MPAFIEAGAPTDDELDALLHTIIARLMKMLTRRGGLVADMGQTSLAETDADGEEARTLRPLQAAPSQSSGPSAGANSPLGCFRPASAPDASCRRATAS